METETVLIGRWAVCSKGRIGRIIRRKQLEQGLSWVGVGLDGNPWASPNPQVIGDFDASILEGLARHESDALAGFRRPIDEIAEIPGYRPWVAIP